MDLAAPFSARKDDPRHGGSRNAGTSRDAPPPRSVGRLYRRARRAGAGVGAVDQPNNGTFRTSSERPLPASLGPLFDVLRIDPMRPDPAFFESFLSCGAPHKSRGE